MMNGGSSVHAFPHCFSVYPLINFSYIVLPTKLIACSSRFLGFSLYESFLSSSIFFSASLGVKTSFQSLENVFTITLNGDVLTPDEGSLTGNNSFNFWNVQEIGARGNLQAGPNTIVITANGAGGCNWDYVDVYYGEVTVTPAQGGGSQGGGSQGGGQQQTGGDTLEPLTGAKQRLEVEEGELDPQAASNYVRGGWLRSSHPLKNA